MLSDEEIAELARDILELGDASAAVIAEHGYSHGPASTLRVAHSMARLLADLRSLRERVEKAEIGLRWLASRRDSLPPQYREFLAPWVTLQGGETDV